MPVEIEAKVRVTDHDAVRRALLDAGATRVGKVRESNTYFDRDGDSLANADAALRTRREVDEAGKVRGRVTYKGPRQAGKFKQREEVEFDVGDADAAADLLEKLGFARVLRFEKDRETFALDDCEIVLDAVPTLGTFVEVEGPSESAVSAVLSKIGLGDAETLARGYASMIAASGQTDLRFDPS